MTHYGIQAALHYLDEYMFIGNPNTSECADALKLALQICEQLGISNSKVKVEGPATILTFLGMELRQPEEKLRRLKLLIQQWKTKKSCTKRDLLSLIGQLHAGLCALEELSPGT